MRMESSTQWSELAAFRQKYDAVMLRCAKCYALNADDAEAIVRGCWRSLLDQLPRLRAMDDHAQSAYLMRSIYHEAVDFYRDKRRMQDAEHELMVGASGQFDSEIAARQELTAAMLYLLPAWEQQVATLKIVGYTNVEVARVLDIDTPYVRMYWMRAQRRVRGYIRALEGLDAF